MLSGIPSLNSFSSLATQDRKEQTARCPWTPGCSHPLREASPAVGLAPTLSLSSASALTEGGQRSDGPQLHQLRQIAPSPVGINPKSDDLNITISIFQDKPWIGRMACAQCRIPVMGKVLEIWIAPAAGEPMQSKEAVQAIPGSGLEGDRYRDSGSWSRDGGTPDREITLIESEQLEWYENETGNHFPSNMTRRNILTKSISLNDFVGKKLHIGSVQLEGLRLCEMCKSLQDRCELPLLPAMVHRGGLNCRIISGGEIRVGDSIEPVNESLSS